MVHITRLPTLFLSLSVLATFFLVSLVESAKVECDSKIQNDVNSSAAKEDKYIVLLNSDDDNNHRDWLEQCYGITMKTTMNSDLAVKGTTLNGYTATLTQGFVKTALEKRKEVKFIEKNGKVSINYAIPNNLFKRKTAKNPQENLDRVDQAKFPLDDEYTFPDTAGEGVNIFVVDTGIDLEHEQFGGRAKDGGSFCSDADACEAGGDGNGHGTHCAGTAGGKTVGVAPKATLIAIQVLDSNGGGSNADVIDGLKSVLAQHQDSDNKNSIVSMSLGGGFSEAVNTVVQSLTDAGIHVVVAAGNDGADACKASPASEPSAITVGALDSTGKKAPKDSVAFFSNIGKCVDIFAPGVDIKSAEAGTAKDLILFSGTSQATPHVAGALALLISKDGNQSPAKMAKAIVDLSTKGLLGKGELKGSSNNVLRVPAP